MLRALTTQRTLQAHQSIIASTTLVRMNLFQEPKLYQVVLHLHNKNQAVLNTAKESVPRRRIKDSYFQEQLLPINLESSKHHRSAGNAIVTFIFKVR